MGWKKCDANRLEAMYDLYQQGFSLALVGKAFGVTRQSVYELFKNNNKATRNKKKLPFLWFDGNKYTLRNHGYYARTDHNRTLMHRDVWEKYNDKIPEGYDIHHKDFDVTNNNIKNLECLPKADHTRLYSPHNNQYTKGRKKR